LRRQRRGLDAPRRRCNHGHVTHQRLTGAQLDILGRKVGRARRRQLECLRLRLRDLADLQRLRVGNLRRRGGLGLRGARGRRRRA
jgi:hypothetical protein